jgi:hypothetical protein
MQAGPSRGLPRACALLRAVGRSLAPWSLGSPGPRRAARALAVTKTPATRERAKAPKAHGDHKA